MSDKLDRCKQVEAYGQIMQVNPELWLWLIAEVERLEAKLLWTAVPKLQKQIESLQSQLAVAEKERGELALLKQKACAENFDSHKKIKKLEAENAELKILKPAYYKLLESYKAIDQKLTASEKRVEELENFNSSAGMVSRSVTKIERPRK